MKLSDLTKIPLTIKMVTEGMIENMLHYYSNPEYIRYKQIISQPRNKVHTTKNAIDRKSTSIFADGGKEVIFDTGVRKEYFTNGYSIIFFPNGDIKQVLGLLCRNLATKLCFTSTAKKKSTRLPCQTRPRSTVSTTIR